MTSTASPADTCDPCDGPWCVRSLGTFREVVKKVYWYDWVVDGWQSAVYEFFDGYDRRQYGRLPDSVWDNPTLFFVECV